MWAKDKAWQPFPNGEPAETTVATAATAAAGRYVAGLFFWHAGPDGHRVAKGFLLKEGKGKIGQLRRGSSQRVETVSR